MRSCTNDNWSSSDRAFQFSPKSIIRLLTNVLSSSSLPVVPTSWLVVTVINACSSSTGSSFSSSCCFSLSFSSSCCFSLSFSSTESIFSCVAFVGFAFLLAPSGVSAAFLFFFFLYFSLMAAIKSLFSIIIPPSYVSPSNIALQTSLKFLAPCPPVMSSNFIGVGLSFLADAFFVQNWFERGASSLSWNSISPSSSFATSNASSWFFDNTSHVILIRMVPPNNNNNASSRFFGVSVRLLLNSFCHVLISFPPFKDCIAEAKAFRTLSSVLCSDFVSVRYFLNCFGKSSLVLLVIWVSAMLEFSPYFS